MSSHAPMSTGIPTPVCLFFLVVTCCFSMSLRFEDDNIRQLFVDACTQITMMIVMGLGLIIMLFFIFRRDSLAEPHARACHDDKMRGAELHKWALKGIILFFVIGSMLDFNYLVAETGCIRAWQLCANPTIRFAHSANFIFHMFRIMFMGCETILCWIFHRLRFKRSLFVVHGLAFIEAANIVLWFDSMISEMWDRIKQNETENCINFMDNGSIVQQYEFVDDSSLFDNSSHCWQTATDEYDWLVESNQFLYPISIEFSLLVGESLAGLFFDCLHHCPSVGGTKLNGQTERQNVDGHERLVSSSSTSSTVVLEPHLSECTKPDETTAFISIGSSPELPPPQVQSSSSIFSGHFLWSKLFRICAAILNIVMIVLSIFVVRASLHSPLATETYNAGYTYFSIIYSSFVCSVFLVGFWSCRSFPRPTSHTSSLEYLLLAATIGPLLLVFTRFTDLLFDLDIKSVSYSLEEILNTAQVMLQIAFYFHAKDVSFKDKQISPQNESRRVRNSVKRFSSRTAFKDVVIIAAFSNINLWVIDSFLLPQAYTSITPSGASSGHWKVLDNIAQPIAIFFRFNSALFFWCVYRQVRKTA